MSTSVKFDEINNIIAGEFNKKGFLLVSDFYKQIVIQNARKDFVNAFESEIWREAPFSNENIINNIYQYFPELVFQLINADLIALLKNIIGEEIVWIPECSIHRNRYIQWHKDTSIQESYNELSHLNYNSPMIQVAIYFQDNDNSGGGLTVIPESHITNDPYSKMLKNNILNRSYYKLLKLFQCSPFHIAENHPNKLDINTKIGDLLLFDLRIDHRSSIPTQKNEKMVDKFAIFNTFGKPDSALKGYFDFMKNRPEPFYRYFQTFPLPDIVYQCAKSVGVNIWY